MPLRKTVTFISIRFSLISKNINNGTSIISRNIVNNDFVKKNHYVNALPKNRNIKIQINPLTSPP